MPFHLTEISSTSSTYHGRLRVDPGSRVSAMARAHSVSGANGNWTSVRIVATGDSGPVKDDTSGEVPSEYAEVRILLASGEYDIDVTSDNHLASSDYVKVICQDV